MGVMRPKAMTTRKERVLSKRPGLSEIRTSLSDRNCYLSEKRL